MSDYPQTDAEWVERFKQLGEDAGKAIGSVVADAHNAIVSKLKSDLAASQKHAEYLAKALSMRVDDTSLLKRAETAEAKVKELEKQTYRLRERLRDTGDCLESFELEQQLERYRCNGMED